GLFRPVELSTPIALNRIHQSRPTVPDSPIWERLFTRRIRMKRLILWFVVMGLAIAAPSLVLNVSPQAATQEVQRSLEQAQDVPSEANYRSPGGRHKIQVTDPQVLEMVKSKNGRTIAV